MATIKRFYDLEVWKNSRQLNIEVYKLKSSDLLRKDFALVDQARRASVSVMANIAEGFGRQGNKEFLQFLSISSGSHTELQSHIFILLDLKYLDQEKFEALFSLTEEVHRMINKFSNYLETSDLKGIKYS